MVRLSPEVASAHVVIGRPQSNLIVVFNTFCISDNTFSISVAHVLDSIVGLCE